MGMILQTFDANEQKAKLMIPYFVHHCISDINFIIHGYACLKLLISFIFVGETMTTHLVKQTLVIPNLFIIFIWNKNYNKYLGKINFPNEW